MSEYIWKNISWKSEYNQYWSFASAGTMETTEFQNLRKCFQEVFGLDVSFDGNYFEAYISGGIPVIFAKGGAGSRVSISGLHPYAALKMRKAGSDNTGIQERVADENGVVVLTPGAGGSHGGQDVSYYFGEIAIGQSFPAYYAKNNTSLPIVEENRYTDYRKTNEYKAKVYDELSSNYYYASLSHFLICNKFGWGGWFYKTPSFADYKIGDSTKKEEQRPEQLNDGHKTCDVSKSFVSALPTVVFTNFNSATSVCQYKYTNDTLEITHNGKTWVFLLDDGDEVIVYRQQPTTISNPTPHTLQTNYEGKDNKNEYNGGAVAHFYNGYIEQEVTLNTPVSYVLPTTSSFISLSSATLKETSDYSIEDLCSPHSHSWKNNKTSNTKSEIRTTQSSSVHIAYDIGYNFKIHNIHRFDQFYFFGSDAIDTNSLTHNSIIGIGGQRYYKVNWANNDPMYGVDGYWPNTPNDTSAIDGSFPKAYHAIIRDGLSGVSPNGWFSHNNNTPLQINYGSVKITLNETLCGIYGYSGDLFFDSFHYGATTAFQDNIMSVAKIWDGNDNEISSVDYRQPVSNPSIGWINSLPKHATIKSFIDSEYTKWYVLPALFWSVWEGTTAGPQLYLPPYGEKPLNGTKEKSYIAYNGKNSITSSSGYSLVIYSKNRKLPHRKDGNKVYRQVAHQHQKLALDSQRKCDYLVDSSANVWADLGSLQQLNDEYYLLLVYTDANGNETCYEWSQKNDPRTSTHGEAMKSITYRGSGMKDHCAEWGGLYRFDDDNQSHENASLRMARPDNPTHWFGAICATQYWNNGVPALPGIDQWNSSGWTGSIDLYCRVA